MKIPFVDLKAQYHNIRPQIDGAIAAVIAETAFIGGDFVKKFEQEYAAMYGVRHVIPCANGTDSLYIILKMTLLKYVSAYPVVQDPSPN